MTIASSFCKKGHCIHILWSIFMGLGHNDPWVESHIRPQQMWGQRSSRCQWPLVQVFAKTVTVSTYSLNVNEWKFHSPIEWNSCKRLKKEWFCTLNSKFPLIKSENHSKKSELPLIWGVKRRTTRKRIVLRLTPQTSGNSLFLESFSLYMSGNLLFNVQNHSFLSGLQEFHSFGEWNFHSFTFREYFDVCSGKTRGSRTTCFKDAASLWASCPNLKHFGYLMGQPSSQKSMLLLCTVFCILWA